MPKVLMTIQAADGPPTLDAVRERYGLSAGAVDSAFGVVLVDPAAGIYTLMVDEAVAPRLVSSDGWTVRGPFANPRIAPMLP